MKLLYVLALFQFVAGPLVILQVSLFCKLTVREVPQAGIGPAFSKAWNSDQFQAALQPGAKQLVTAKEKDKSPAPQKDPQVGSAKAKMPVIGWLLRDVPPPVAIGRVAMSDWCRRWTPVWPQAPPGPPPRMG